MKRLIRRLLHKNLSLSQLSGFILSNFAGLAIVILGLQFFEDARPIWEDEDSFIRKDYLVINKRVTGAVHSRADRGDRVTALGAEGGPLYRRRLSPHGFPPARGGQRNEYLPIPGVDTL